ncbi:hypothetical protein J7I98_14500 [Streptomyces sp. ISL-98]|uniref:hypothetical protein n=1 Tax=Streptomyces sp. ISL-98 TaxID=2819192 RepID=UPI001BE81078|nr:hypothetical protein [Streptomyces sp. ISL-98]MBT2507076.1 hypothetical protein [Streptomyces sp. ISL-98]
MAFAISSIVLFGVLLALLLRFKALGVGAAVVALLFGFYVAKSDAAPFIDQIMSAVANTLRKF